MKKQYISPVLCIDEVELQQFVCNSITEVNGDAGIGKGGDEDDDDNPVSADSRRRHDVWEDEDNNDNI